MTTSCPFLALLVARDQAIINEFSPFFEAPTLLLEHLMTYGKALTPLSLKEKAKSQSIVGCVGSLSVINWGDQKRIYFKGDGGALISKGLLALAIRLYSGGRPREVASYLPRFPLKLRLSMLLGEQRKQGWAAILNFFQKEASRLDRFGGASAD